MIAKKEQAAHFAVERSRTYRSAHGFNLIILLLYMIVPWLDKQAAAATFAAEIAAATPKLCTERKGRGKRTTCTSPNPQATKPVKKTKLSKMSSVKANSKGAVTHFLYANGCKLLLLLCPHPSLGNFYLFAL